MRGIYWITGPAALAWLAYCPAPVRAQADTPERVFETRLLPIFKSPNPSSCVQCHLAGVDLKDYILPDAGKTFRSLRDQGLIDLDAPAKSKIVKLIDMGGDTKANAVHAKARAAEREAFLAWIAACAKDPKLRAAPKLDRSELAKPDRPDAVIRHARKDRLLESFEANVWAWRFRCMNCHTEGTPQNDKYRKEYGDRVAWFKKGGAAETMEYVIASKLIDPQSPEKSLLLRKPLNDAKHEGGLKFLVGDQAYKGFRLWIEDVAAIRGGKYAAAADLPAPDPGPRQFGTDIWLKLTGLPAAWGGKHLQADVYAWDAGRQSWEADPVATSDRAVAPKGGLWQHNLTLLAANGSERATAWAKRPAPLPRGRYLIRLSVDRGGRLAKDWTAVLGEGDFAGSVEVESAWPEGYGRMTAVDGRKLRK